jgi:hypothetical protein
MDLKDDIPESSSRSTTKNVGAGIALHQHFLLFKHDFDQSESFRK